VVTAEEGRAILERVRVAMSNAAFVKVPPASIRPMPGQPRVYFHDERIRRLADSIRSFGQIQPGIIRTVRQDGEGRDREILDGERRWRAVALAGVPEYRAMQVEIDNEAAPFVVSIIANFNRESHTTLEVVDSIVKMHDFLKLPMKEIAEAIGFTLSYVSNLYTLRKLAPEVRDLLDPNLGQNKRLLPVIAAIHIARLPAGEQLPLATRVMSRDVSIANLTIEARNIARSSGLKIRGRTMQPNEMRKSIDRRVAVARISTRKLADTCHASGASLALEQWPSKKLAELEAQLFEAGKNILASYEVIKRAREKKLPTLVRR
jgi:ParB/RepB/Spo0J family partition protein